MLFYAISFRSTKDSHEGIQLNVLRSPDHLVRYPEVNLFYSHFCFIVRLRNKNRKNNSTYQIHEKKLQYVIHRILCEDLVIVYDQRAGLISVIFLLYRKVLEDATSKISSQHYNILNMYRQQADKLSVVSLSHGTPYHASPAQMIEWVCDLERDVSFMYPFI